MHLSCVREMIPHFHAAGHLNYAKSARLYLQQMESLNKTIPEEEYRLFTEKGYFTIRCCDSFWGGNFFDQTIEQFQMKFLKCFGGMTHRRGTVLDEILEMLCRNDSSSRYPRQYFNKVGACTSSLCSCM